MKLHPFEQHVADAWPRRQWQHERVLVAVSGGPDSVALLRALDALRDPQRTQLVVAHYNHSLRGAEAANDAQFVRALADRLGLFCQSGEAAATAHGTPDEASLRDTRYQFLSQTAGDLGARYVVTGHTADDQAETILHRILRGTGIAGLSGIPFARPLMEGVALVRPLLTVRREQVLDYLSAIEQPFRSDASNSMPTFTRNRIRLELLPRLAADYNGQVVEAICRLGSLAGETQAAVDQLVEQILSECVLRELPHTLELDRTRLARQSPFLVRECLVALWRRQAWPLQSMTLEKWKELAALLVDGAVPTSRQTARLSLPGEIMAEASAERLLFRRTSDPGNATLPEPAPHR